MKTIRNNNYNFIDLSETIDSGVVDTVSSSIDIRGAISLYIRAEKDTGSIEGATLTLQTSPDDVNWDDTDHSLVFSNENPLKRNNLPETARYARIKVTVKSTIASTADITIQGK